MSLSVSGFIFDRYEGEIVLPKWAGEVFSHPGTPNAGVHMRPPRGEPFTLRVTRLDDDRLLDEQRRRVIDQIGITQDLIDAEVNYLQLPYRLRFFITDVVVVSAERINFASGFRGGSSYQFTPACRLVFDITFVPVPVS